MIGNHSPQTLDGQDHTPDRDSEIVTIELPECVIQAVKQEVVPVTIPFVDQVQPKAGSHGKLAVIQSKMTPLMLYIVSLAQFIDISKSDVDLGRCPCL